MANEMFCVVDFHPFPLSYGAEKGAHNSDNRVPLARFVKARFFFRACNISKFIGIGNWKYIEFLFIHFLRF